MSAGPLAGESAVTGLHRSDPRGPGISRERAERGFTYRDPAGAPVTDDPVLARIRVLAIRASTCSSVTGAPAGSR